MQLRTPLHPCHVEAGAKLVDFGGWDMPLHYGSQIDEHHAVRRAAGLFDVSHMTVVDVAGATARDFLRYLLANDVDKLAHEGQALYSCMLNHDGGVVDDLIVYWRGGGNYRLVVNAATRTADLAWLTSESATFDVDLREREELAMLAVQGPTARELAVGVLPAEHREAMLALRPFHGAEFGAAFVARTGYTGEDGFEIMCRAGQAVELWQALTAAGAHPCGLGARDTLRLEAGMNLYGADMDTSTTPLESGLSWTVAWAPRSREFIGRGALELQKANGVPRKLVGLLLQGRGVMRDHQVVHTPSGGRGEITSGSYSPTLERSIAFARVPADCGAAVEVEIRGKRLPASVHRPPFVRNGRAKIDL